MQIGVTNTGPDHPQKDWSKFTPKVGLRYDYSDNMMVFGTWSSGYRAGGYNGRVSGGPGEARTPYDPKELDNFEVGI